MAKSWLLFDYDDTLGGIRLNGEVVPGCKAYDDCIDRFAAELAFLGFPEAEVKRVQLEIDCELSKTHGFGDKRRFAQSFEASYFHLCYLAGTPPQSTIAERVFAIGMSVFTDYPYALLPGAEGVLSFFAQTRRYNIAIVTKGAFDEQMKKLVATDVLKYSHVNLVLDHKNMEEWTRLLTYTLGMTAAQVRQSWTIGNSIKADINPPMRLGVNAIHLADKNGWSFEHAEYEMPREGQALVTVQQIHEVPTVIALHEQNLI